LDSKLLYDRAQQMNPWRAGTPGRALRNRRAVVRYWRPLRLFICLMVSGLASVAPLAAQTGLPTKPTVTLRVGAFVSTPLVKDAVSSAGLDDSIPGQRSHDIRLQQKLGPIATLAIRFPMRAHSNLELSGSVGRSTVHGDDGIQSWDAMPVTVGNFVVGFGYLYRNIIVLHGGVGLTKLFAEERGLFSKGNSIKPVLEAGASSSVHMGTRPIELQAMVQSHSFGTTTLRDNGGSDGNVMRAIVQIGTTLWQAGR